MRPITRVAKPAILVHKEAKWTQDFLDKPTKNRPDTSKYAHQQIKDALIAMSDKKCFYSEVVLAEKDMEVDHFIGIKERREWAFRWENLYLSANWINRRKRPHSEIPVEETIDPVGASIEEIETALQYHDAEVRGISPEGKNTVRKYLLQADGALVQQRYKFTSAFYKRQGELLTQDHGVLSEASKAELRAWADFDRPFSLMFRCILRQLQLL